MMLNRSKAKLNNSQQRQDIKQATADELSQNDLATIVGGKSRTIATRVGGDVIYVTFETDDI